MLQRLQKALDAGPAEVFSLEHIMTRAARFDTRNVGSRIRGRREELRLSMRRLASRAGLAVSFISKIESGKASPTVMSLLKILEALEVDVADFFRENGARNGADRVVFPRSEMRLLEGQGRRWWYAFPATRDFKVVLTYEEYAPRTRILERERHPRDICGYVLSGESTIEIVGRGLHRVKKGDAFYIRADQEHVCRNEGRRTLKMLVAEIKVPARPGRTFS